jgi:hypothetical protein
LLSIRETDRRQFMKSQAGRSAWIPTELLREFVRHPVDRLLDRGDILSRPAIFPGLDQAEIGGGGVEEPFNADFSPASAPPLCQSMKTAIDVSNVPRCLSGAGIMGLCDHLS